MAYSSLPGGKMDIIIILLFVSSERTGQSEESNVRVSGISERSYINSYH